jgi:hypothetical protein
MQPKIGKYEVNEKLSWWNSCICSIMQSLSDLNHLHISLCGQACIRAIEAYFWSFWYQGIIKIWIIIMTFSKTASDDLKMASEVKS